MICSARLDIVCVYNDGSNNILNHWHAIVWMAWRQVVQVSELVDNLAGVVTNTRASAHCLHVHCCNNKAVASCNGCIAIPAVNANNKIAYSYFWIPAQLDAWVVTPVLTGADVWSLLWRVCCQHEQVIARWFKPASKSCSKAIWAIAVTALLVNITNTALYAGVRISWVWAVLALLAICYKPKRSVFCSP